MHKDQERFREVDLGTRSGDTVTRSGKDLIVAGTCGRCNARSTFTINNGVAIGGSGKGLGRRQPPDLPTATVFCGCGFFHDGRPEGSDENGCGAYWSVAIGGNSG